MAGIHHSIKAAAKLSGLTPHVIRVWEKRYAAVLPERTDTNRRLYSDEEVERLTLLRGVTQAGHSIGNVARLPVERLRALVADAGNSDQPSVKRNGLPEESIRLAIQAVQNLDAPKLDGVLSKAATLFGQHGLLEKVIHPFAVRLGELWREGTITAAHEHFASSVIRSFLIRNSRPYAMSGNSPTIIVATPAGQVHELGAVMVAAAANDMGWKVVYLGTSLPALEIAGAARQNKARAVALSIVFPGDDASLPGELETLRKHLPDEVELLVGGRSSASYEPTLKRVGAVHVRELQELYGKLEKMRATLVQNA